MVGWIDGNRELWPCLKSKWVNIGPRNDGLISSVNVNAILSFGEKNAAFSVELSEIQWNSSELSSRGGRSLARSCTAAPFVALPRRLLPAETRLQRCSSFILASDDFTVPLNLPIIDLSPTDNAPPPRESFSPPRISFNFSFFFFKMTVCARMVDSISGERYQGTVIPLPLLQSPSNFASISDANRLDRPSIFAPQRGTRFPIPKLARLFFIPVHEYLFFPLFFFPLSLPTTHPFFSFCHPSQVISLWRDLHPVCRQAVGLFFEDGRVEDYE